MALSWCSKGPRPTGRAAFARAERRRCCCRTEGTKMRRLITALCAVAFAIPGSWSRASADHLPFAIGLGEYVPVSPSANVEGLSTLPGTTVRQTGNVGIEVSVGPQLHPGSYQISAMILSQRQSV